LVIKSVAYNREVSARDNQVRKVLLITLFINLVSVLIKAWVGKHIDSVAVIADAIHSLLDASSNVVGLIGISIAARPADDNHPYGHRRFETVASVIIGLLIAGSVFELGRTIYEGLLAPHHTPRVSWTSFVAVALTAPLNFALSAYERRRAKQLRSAVLAADAKHALSDAVSACVVLASFAAVAAGWRSADLVAAAVVCVFIVRTAWHVLSTNVGALTDCAQLDPREVKRIALAVEGVRGTHRIRSRGSNDYVYVDLHVHLDPLMPLQQAHSLSHDVADALRTHFENVKDVVVHIEPADGREHEESPTLLAQ